MNKTNRNELIRAKGRCGKVHGRPAQELKQSWPLTLGWGLLESNLKSPKNSAVITLDNKPGNYLFSFDTRYLQKRIRLKINLNLGFNKLKYKKRKHSFNLNYIAKNLNLKKT